MACEAFEIAKKIPDCLLTKANDTTDYTIGLSQKVNSTGNVETDFYKIGYIDVFNNEVATKCMTALMNNLLQG